MNARVLVIEVHGLLKAPSTRNAPCPNGVLPEQRQAHTAHSSKHKEGIIMEDCAVRRSTCVYKEPEHVEMPKHAMSRMLDKHAHREPTVS